MIFKYFGIELYESFSDRCAIYLQTSSDEAGTAGYPIDEQNWKYDFLNDL